MDHAEEAVGELVVASGDSAVDLEVAEHALDAVALLVERTVMLDLYAAVWPAGYDSLDLSVGKVSSDRVGIVALVGKQRDRCAFRQVDQVVIGLAVRRFANR